MSKIEPQKKDLLRDKFQHELNELDKTSLVNSFQLSCLQQLYSGNSVYLDNFGLLSPVTEKRITSIAANDRNISRTIRYQSIIFQKCSELTGYVREKYSSITEEKELSEIIFSKLPTSLQAEWKLEKTRSYLCGLILAIKHDVITQGICKLVSTLGDFYSLHNRQGSSPDDWYAGSNIIFESHSDRELSCEECNVYESPVLQNAWEIMNCIYGQPVHIFSINICSELKKLGFDLDRSYFGDKIDQENIQIAIYARKSANQQQMIYCTDGLRKLNLSSTTFGSEFVFQAAYDADFRDSAKNSEFKLDDILLPDWPKSIIVMGWIMLQNSEAKSVTSGASLTFRKKLCSDLENSKLTAVICTPYASCKNIVKADEGAFKYVNLLGITDDEYRLSENYSPDILLNLLKARRMDQITKLCRPNLLAKTAFLDLNESKIQKNTKPDGYVSKDTVINA